MPEMLLFNDEDFFSTGRPKRQKMNMPDAEVLHIESFFGKEDSDRYFNLLLNQTPWEEFRMTVYDKSHVVPRMIAWYEDQENPGASSSRTAWTPELLEIREKVERETGIRFNSVLLNLYRDGSDGVGWHSDREENFGKDAIIASVTFGQTRPFRLRHKFSKDLPMIEILLNHGSFLLMAGTTQSFWQHQIPKSAKSMAPRINLTFRQVKRNR